MNVNNTLLGWLLVTLCILGILWLVGVRLHVG